MSPPRSSLVALMVALIFGATVTLLFAPSLFGGETIGGGILATFYYPHYGALAERLTAGEVPLWNPLLGSGASWFGPRAGGVVYPANLLFGFLSLRLGLACFLALHVLLAAEGARRVARRDGSQLAGLGTGLAYGCGGCLLSLYGNPVFLVSAAWLPWAALGGSLVGRSASRGVALSGAAIGCCFLAGEPQGALCAAILTVGSACWEPGPAPRRQRVLFAGLSVSLGAAAGALTVVSTLSLLPETDRALSGWGGTEFGLAPVATLLDLLVPGVVGLHADSTGGFWGERIGAKNLWCLLSVGTLGLAAALASVHSPRRRALHEGAALVLLGLLLAGIDAGHPFSLRFPSKWLVFSALGLARLTGLGLEALRAGPAPAGTRALAILAGVGLIGGGVLLDQAGAFEGWLGQGAERLVPGEARAAAVFACLRAAVVGTVGWALVTRLRNLCGRRLLGALLLGLLVFDLLSAYKPLVRTTATDLLARPALAEFLDLEGDRSLEGEPAGVRAPMRFAPRGDSLPLVYELPQRLQGISRLERSDLFYRDVLWANLGVLQGVRTVGAFETSRPAARALLEASPAFRQLPLPQRLALIDARYLLIGRPEYDREGAPKDLVMTAPVSPRMKGMIGLARNDACPPWAYVVPMGVTVPDLRTAVSALFQRSGWNAAVLGPELPADGPPLSSPPKYSIELVRYAPEKIELRVDVDGPGWLIVREGFHPDWVAAVDGREVTIARADALYRALPLPAGEHRVVFECAPSWWWPALSLTLLGWLGLLGAAAVSVLSRRV